jgi:hypothetical protein
LVAVPDWPTDLRSWRERSTEKGVKSPPACEAPLAGAGDSSGTRGRESASLGGRGQPGSETHRSLTAAAVVRNTWSLTLSLPYTMTWRLKTTIYLPNLGCLRPVAWWGFLYPSTQRHNLRLISLLILLHVLVVEPSSRRKLYYYLGLLN